MVMLCGFNLTFDTCNGCCSGAPKLGVLELVQSNLTALIRTCLLYGGRSTAHKVARFIALCLEYVMSLLPVVRLHRIHDMQTIEVDDPGIYLSVC